eukprot:CAMPEP_0117696926 /NCGR_PEP_ID=MMETSP0804-20121206/28935_1 /TAXON_ID=1074897 /ORGANISM="Tetraselmis astigmatica, Strain CCMP880" /LENGTH=589 /DNA_ID=CAMNT_0005511101 /DNA_START=365 /DNA_END=2131 /DNA_ORIENTATION=-
MSEGGNGLARPPTTTSGDAPAGSPVAALAAWTARQEGGKISPKVGIPGAHSRSGKRAGDSTGADRELWLREPVKSGEVLIELPLQDLITVDTAASDERLGPAFKELQVLDGAGELCTLVLYLLCLQWLPGPLQPGHRAYVCSLPSSCPTPLGWPAEMLQALEATPLSAAIQQQANVLEELCSVWVGKLLARLRTAGVAGCDDSHPLPPPPRSQVLLSFSMVGSRAFTVKWPDGSKKLCLIPLVDMLDHSYDVDTEYTTTGSSTEKEDQWRFQLVAASNQPAGGPLWINYGPSKGNADLLTHHGFCVPNNTADRFTANLRVSLQPGTALDDQRMLLHVAGCSLEAQLSRGQPLPGCLLQTLAILHLPPQCSYYLAAKCLQGMAAGLSPDTPRHSAPRDPLYSGAVLTVSEPDDVPLPLAPAVSTTLETLLGNELLRCEAAAEGLPDAEELLATRPRGASDPREATAFYLKGQLDVLRAARQEALEWKGRMLERAEGVAALAPAGEGDDMEGARWHCMELDVPAERLHLVQLSGLGDEHWLPELPGTEEVAGTLGQHAIDICWSRVMAAASVCCCSLEDLERCGAPQLLGV